MILIIIHNILLQKLCLHVYRLLEQVAVNHVSAADGEAAVADDLTPREGRGGARLRREAAGRADRPRLRHNRRVPTVKTNEAEPRGEFRKRIARKVKIGLFV